MRKRSIGEIICILGIPQFLSAILVAIYFKYLWNEEFIHQEFTITIESLKTICVYVSLFWMFVIMRNLIFITSSKKIGFFTWMEKYRYEPRITTLEKARAQFPEIPSEYLSNTPDGFVIGKKGKKYIRVKLKKGNILNAIILGSAGCGKSVLLLTMLIYQLHKNELSNKTKKNNATDKDKMTFYVTDIKREMGPKSIIIPGDLEEDNERKVHYLDVSDRSCYGWDIYFALNPESSNDEIMAELDILARALIDEGKSEKNVFFYQHARIIFKNILLWQYKQGRSFIQGLDYLMTGSLESVINNTLEKTEGKPEYSLIYKNLSSYTDKKGEAFEGIELSMRQQLDIFNQQSVRYFLDNNRPRKASYRDLENKTSLIFGLAESKLDEYKSLLRLITMQIKEHSIKRPETSHMLTFIIDEAARLGVDWTDFLATSRSRQICTILAFQSFSQAEEKWGKEKTKSLLELCRIIAVLSCTDTDMARVLGEWAGDYKEYKESVTNGGNNEGSSSVSYEDKKILTQSDIMDLQDNKEVIAFIKGKYLRMDVDGARYYNIPELNRISKACIAANKKYLEGVANNG